MAERNRVVGFGMTGESNLKTLLREIKPQVVPGEFVFCSIQKDELKSVNLPLLIFQEPEGITVIVTKEVANQHGLSYESTWGLVSLTVHSDLEAVGFLAAVTNHLAKAGVSVNAVSAYHHDHLFVPYNRTDEVIALLNNLSKQA
jgi:hypothetical protein